MPDVTVRKLGPADHGRRMSLVEFDRMEGEPGYTYELARGVIVGSDVPSLWHFLQVDALQDMLRTYKRSNPGVIFAVGDPAGCKLLIEETESERHPDVSLYLAPPPEREPQPWANWVPEIVIEVVSPSSASRDYEDKREEYLLRGCREYWLVDEEQQRLTALRRHGRRWREKVLQPPESYETRLLPGFELNLAAVFAPVAALRQQDQ